MRSELTGRTREEYEADVSRPGKFEGEPAYVPYFWDCAMHGCADDCEEIAEDEYADVFFVDEEDRKLFPELELGQRIVIGTSDSGFVCEY